MKSNYLILGMVALATALTVFELAAQDTDPRQQVRIIDLPPVTEAALLTSGIDRHTLNDYLAQTSVEVPHGPVTAYTSQPNGTRISSSIAAETDQEVKPAPGRTRPSTAGRSSQQIVTREKRDGHSRVPKVGQWVKVEISTYSKSYHGGRTASGERYDHHKGYTAATTYRKGWVLPRGSVWEVEYLGQSITVRINDTGSWRPKRAPYWLDLSGAAWRDLTGIAPSRKVGRMRRVR
ncbi:MAG: septal ring lytic transglycosylase RlpA family protein [Fimbriimonadaceae bacterium]|nr:septal ring lytic transglycosylase RlpA family protein [Fimbriimonadaceae bacterium]